MCVCVKDKPGVQREANRGKEEREKEEDTTQEGKTEGKKNEIRVKRSSKESTGG